MSWNQQRTDTTPGKLFWSGFLRAWAWLTGLGGLLFGLVIRGMNDGLRVGSLTGSWRPNFGLNVVFGCIFVQILALPLAFLIGLIWRVSVVSLASRPPSERHCPQCDYNLLGNISGRCPECGELLAPPEAEKKWLRIDRRHIWAAWMNTALAEVLPLSKKHEALQVDRKRLWRAQLVVVLFLITLMAAWGVVCWR